MSKTFFINGDLLKNGSGCYVNDEKDHHFDTKVEIKIVEPVYAYQVVYKCIEFNGNFYMTNHFYVSKEDFDRRNYGNGYEFIELYQPSKRERI